MYATPMAEIQDQSGEGRRVMARARVEFEGFDEIIRRLSKVEGAAEKVTDKALRETHALVTHKIQQVFTTSNMPAKGRYWTGDTLETLRRDANVEWNGSVANVPVGFEIKGAGITSIFLTHGTPRHKPPMKAARGLYDAIFGAKTKQEVVEKQQEIFYSELAKLGL